MERCAFLCMEKTKGKGSFELNMSEGPLVPKLIMFAVPLMLSSILQLLYNAADVIVVGRFAEDNTALAAVTSTGALINLIVNLFIGLSVGANVAVARYFGAKNDRDVRETVHTSMLVSVISGVIVAIIGFFGSRTFLGWMDSPADVIDQAALYMEIYFLGMPASLAYNFGASILRATGDTRRPLVYLSISGAVNVVLNLILVAVFHMGVAGVAIATTVSQVISAILVVLCLMRAEGTPYRLRLKELRIYKDKLLLIMQTGIPAGIQGSVFSLSNVQIQSAINSFGSVAMAGNGAAGNLEGFVYVAMNSFHHAALTASSQNLGASNFKRIRRVLLYCLLIVCVVGISLGLLVWAFGEPLLGIYDDDPAVIDYGMIRLGIIMPTYFICGMMDVFGGMMRGIGSSIAPTVVSLLGACGLRVVWIYTVFAMTPTLKCLYISYPVSWFVTGLAHAICFLVVSRRLFRKLEKKTL